MCHDLKLFTGQNRKCQTETVTHVLFMPCTDVIKKGIIIVVILI